MGRMPNAMYGMWPGSKHWDTSPGWLQREIEAKRRAKRGLAGPVPSAVSQMVPQSVPTGNYAPQTPSPGATALPGNPFGPARGSDEWYALPSTSTPSWTMGTPSVSGPISGTPQVQPKPPAPQVQPKPPAPQVQPKPPDRKSVV